MPVGIALWAQEMKISQPSFDAAVLQDLANLAAVIKERLTSGPFLVVFDNVWDGSIFRRDCLNVLPEDKPGQATSHCLT